MLRAMLMLSMLGISLAGWSQERFNLNALETDHTGQEILNADLINQGLEQIPGEYRMAVNVNGRYLFTQEYIFEPGNDNQLTPVLRYDDLINFGFSISSLAGHGIKSKIRGNVLPQILPGIQVRSDLESQTLTLNIPQEYMSSSEFSNALFASDGINVAFVNYDLSGDHQIKAPSSERDAYLLTLQNGINLGAWRYRSLLNLSSEQTQTHHIRDNYVVRSFPQFKSRLIGGESDTPSDIFDSLRIRGIQMESDDSMLSDTEQNFSPVIHGIAPSQATVSVLKNGDIIYKTFVEAGPFSLDKLPAEASNGELEIRITELNGKITTFRYASSSLPVLLREGKQKYSFALGHLLLNDRKPTDAMQATYARGISPRQSLYGGIIFASGYKTALAGIAVDLGKAGALSLDIASALLNNTYTLGGIRSRYYKSVEETGTIISIENTFFPDSRYFDINSQGILSGLKGHHNQYLTDIRKKSDIQVNVNQQVPFGSLYAAINRQTYINKLNNRLGINVGFNTTFKGITMNLNAARIMHYLNSRSENQYSIYFQIPFSIFGEPSTAGASITSSDNESVLNSTLSGSAMTNNRLTYSLQKSRALSSGQETLNMNAGYYASQFQGRVGYAQNTTRKQMSYELKGGIVAHSGGLTYSQTTGETFAIINTSGKSGIELAGSKGIVSDRNGFMIAPSLTPYKQNTIQLAMPDDNKFIEISEPIKISTPSSGAADLIRFKVKNGIRALFLMHYGSGFVPFGATVTTSEDEDDAAIVDSSGRVYLSGLEQHGVIVARWGRGQGNLCKAVFRLSAQEFHPHSGIINKELQCR